MKGWKIILVIFLVVGVVAVGGYFGFASKPEQQAPIIEAPPTVAVTICDVEQTVTAPGSVVNTRQVTLEMPVSGRLAEILVRPGDQVEAGQTLARLDDEEDFVAAVASA